MERVLLRLKGKRWIWGWWLDDGVFAGEDGQRYGYDQVVGVYGGDYLQKVAKELGGGAEMIGEIMEAMFEGMKKETGRMPEVGWKR